MCVGCLSGAEVDRYVAALAQLAERRQLTREQVAVAYDVPLHLLPEEGE